MAKEQKPSGTPVEAVEKPVEVMANSTPEESVEEVMSNVSLSGTPVKAVEKPVNSNINATQNNDIGTLGKTVEAKSKFKKPKKKGIKDGKHQE